MKKKVELQICLIGNPAEGTQDKEVKAMIDPADVSMVHEAYDWGAMIYMKAGPQFLTRLSYDQVLQKLNIK
ncbi:MULTISPECIES: hypothetical protein [unclassified Paraflavitalea]|uniref:hypothetical protein n=1 Tax=unclassified Paraflavitalea TaxID=2798305 RepID=UPI003D357284